MADNKEQRHAQGRDAYKRNVSPTAFRTWPEVIVEHGPTGTTRQAEPAPHLDYLFGYIEALAEDLRETKAKLAEVSLSTNRY